MPCLPALLTGAHDILQLILMNCWGLQSWKIVSHQVLIRDELEGWIVEGIGMPDDREGKCGRK